jgi:hypothetical protein
MLRIANPCARLAELVGHLREVQVLVAGQDAVNAGADHLQEGVLRQVGVAGVV